MKVDKKEVTRIARQLFAIGNVTFFELTREKVLWSSFLFGIFCVGLAYAVAQVAFVDNGRIAVDFGLTSISLIGGLISIIMGSSLIAKEVQNRTLYLVLTKSIWRWQFVVGRYLGLVCILFLNALIMTFVVLAVSKAVGGELNSNVAKSLILQIAEFAVLAAIASIFSVFSTATLGAIFASGVWVMGHAMTDLKILSEKIEPVMMRPVLGLIARLLPDLSRFDIKAEVAHHLPVTWGYTFVTVAYGASYICFALAVSCIIFSRRDL